MYSSFEDQSKSRSATAFHDRSFWILVLANDLPLSGSMRQIETAVNRTGLTFRITPKTPCRNRFERTIR
jgi:hypothetical protein